MKKKTGAIYATHSAEKQLFYKAMVNGILCAAYVKDGQLISYEPWEDVNRQMYTGPCLPSPCRKRKHLTIRECDGQSKLRIYHLDVLVHDVTKPR